MFTTNREKEVIHSGHFMVSDFEAEAQDDEDDLAVTLPDERKTEDEPIKTVPDFKVERKDVWGKPVIGIETSLSKLFKCMSLAYRQKLTSPKWNRFRGVRLRWKDKIRLNNVIWRCWHMQFIKKKNTMICPFASPLDVDTHNKPEAVVLEGKYWKRKLAAVTAEYKKWRMFYRNQQFGSNKDSMEIFTEMEMMAWNAQTNYENTHMLVDEDYMGLMSDTLFSTISSQPFPFPDSREIARAGLADFIQPSLGPLQPNLDDYMDTFEPFHELMSGRLATVPEENPESITRWAYSEMDMIHSNLHALPAPVQGQLEQFSQLSTVLPVKETNYASLGAPHAIQTRHSVQHGAQPLAAQHSSQLILSAQQVSSFGDPNVSLYGVGVGMGVGVTPAGGLISTKANENPKLPSLTPPPSFGKSNNFYIGETLQETNNFKVEEDFGYKFTPPVTPNIKFTSQASTVHKEEKRLKSNRGRPRSRSNTREPLKKPPLLAANSDPSLITSANSALLTQLLTNSDNNPIFSRRSRNLHDVRIKDEAPSVSQPATLIITAPVTMTALHSQEPLMLNSLSSSNSPILESQSLNSPTSSQSSFGSPTREPGKEQRRAGHIHAEQKRRYNIKNGFDMIHSLIPHLNQNPNTKLSKAAMLQKGAEYIKQLRLERNTIKDEMDSLRQQIERLNASISNCQSMLPATGAPVSRRRDNKMQEMFDEYVRRRTMQDWKFWIFSLLFRPLLVSFSNFVSTSSLDDLYRSTLLWIEQHCTLVDLRPIVLNSLRHLCTKTDILSEPEKLPDEARLAVQQQHQQ